MTILIVRRRPDNLLEPIGCESEELIKSKPVGVDFIVEVNDKRNAGNHRRFFSFVNFTFDIQDDYESKEIWRKVLMIKAGYFDSVLDKTGYCQQWAHSVSWDRMEEQKFRRVFGDVVQAFISSEYCQSEEVLNRAVSF